MLSPMPTPVQTPGHDAPPPRTGLWRLIPGIVLALFVWMAVSALILGAAAGVVGLRAGPEGMMPFLQELARGQSPWAVLLVLSTFFGLGLGTVIAAAALHFRPAATLFGPWPRWWRGFRTALGLTLLAMGGAQLLGLLIEAPAPGLAPGRWLMFLPLAAGLILVQTGAEELFFRGYLQQTLAARWQARWVWMGLPSAGFALLHYAPQADLPPALIVLWAGIFGLLAADLTARTGSLGAAMGLHLGNNMAALLLVGDPGMLGGLALYLAPAGGTGAWTGLGMQLALLWLLRRLILRRLCG